MQTFLAIQNIYEEKKWLIKKSNTTRRNSNSLRTNERRENFPSSQNSFRGFDRLKRVGGVYDWESISLQSRYTTGRLQTQNKWVAEGTQSESIRRIFKKPINNW